MAQTTEEAPLVGGRYRLIPDSPLPPLGGIAACQAVDLWAPGAALTGLLPEYVSPRFEKFRALRAPALLPILGHDETAGSFCAVMSQPPGVPVSDQTTPWREGQIIDGVIKPLAALLERVQEAGLTLRCLRPDTVYVGPGMHQIVVLPPAFEMPAARQPVAFEPLSSAVCAPAARGAGGIADDVFSLGVLVLTLCAGQPPFADLSDQDILERRFAQGSREAYLQAAPVTRGLASVLKAMLSDDASQRPGPRDLMNMEPSKFFSVRAERTALAPLSLDGLKSRTPRELAWRGASHPAALLRALREGIVENWMAVEFQDNATCRALREMMGQIAAGTAMETEEDALSRAVHILDPQAPVWRSGRWFWPEALPAMLVDEAIAGTPSDPKSGVIPLVGQILAPHSSYARWSGPIGAQVNALTHAYRRTRRKGVSRLWRLVYDTNPWQRCLSPDLISQRLSDPRAVLLAVDRALEHSGATSDAADVARIEKSGVLDIHVRTFLESACQRNGLAFEPSGSETGAAFWQSDLLLMITVQRMCQIPALRGIARHLRVLLEDEVKTWRSRTRRGRRADRLRAAIEKGNLYQVWAAVHDPSDALVDRNAHDAAHEELLAIEKNLSQDEAASDENDVETIRLAEFAALLTGIVVAILSCVIEFVR
ncbi:serine/threonine-protein kinase [Acidomonas methanolica]|uniref:hypothetical protein n=1 Tax=Acidomonas methanolica TaxID=437 RepID=UPI00211A7E6D|nr:hypothetical protein [Acidomonas methanolica]MCQ9156919.1 hypothetical protein [Acidomonas methanolica]